MNKDEAGTLVKGWYPVCTQPAYNLRSAAITICKKLGYDSGDVTGWPKNDTATSFFLGDCSEGQWNKKTNPCKPGRLSGSEQEKVRYWNVVRSSWGQKFGYTFNCPGHRQLKVKCVGGNGGQAHACQLKSAQQQTGCLMLLMDPCLLCKA